MTVGRPPTSFANFCDKKLVHIHAAVDADGLAVVKSPSSETRKITEPTRSAGF
jgi:hypothetical protein